MFNNLERRRTVWIVDDSTHDAERVRRVLCDDYNVEVMTDGSVALERLAGGALPDLLLVDWLMPGISGIEVTRYIRSSTGRLPNVPIILLTAQHGSDEIVHAFSSGANDYISKPFVDEELRVRVQTLISSKILLERAENAEADVRSLLFNAPDPIFAINAQGNITFANEQALQVTGQKLDAILGKPFTELLPGFIYGNIALGPGSSLLPLPDIQISDRIFSPSIRILPSDTSASTTVALRDVTDRRRDEARRLDFYSIIAHDLRTPITSVLMRLQLAFRGKHGVLAPTLTEDLKRIESSLKAQVGMVNDFLELAKLEGVGYKIDLQPIEMTELIAQVMEDFQPLLEKSNIEWNLEISGDSLTALGDRSRLTQVLANLVGNAIKFTPGAGKITMRVSRSGQFIETSVSDTGRGIAADELPHLFERFMRARESAHDTIGTGLGLMIVREIVEAHGGTIAVESTEGVGSKFSFLLPRCLESRTH